MDKRRTDVRGNSYGRTYPVGTEIEFIAPDGTITRGTVERLGADGKLPTTVKVGGVVVSCEGCTIRPARSAPAPAPEA